MIEMERHYSMLRSLFNKEKSLKPITANDHEEMRDVSQRRQGRVKNM